MYSLYFSLSGFEDAVEYEFMFPVLTIAHCLVESKPTRSAANEVLTRLKIS